MKPSLAKLLTRVEAALFRAGYNAAKLNPVAVEADDRGGARVKLETYAPGPDAWWVDPFQVREDLEREGLSPVISGFPDRPDTILLWCNHHKPKSPNGFVGLITDESP